MGRGVESHTPARPGIRLGQRHDRHRVRREPPDLLAAQRLPGGDLAGLHRAGLLHDHPVRSAESARRALQLAGRLSEVRGQRHARGSGRRPAVGADEHSGLHRFSHAPGPEHLRRRQQRPGNHRRRRRSNGERGHTAPSLHVVAPRHEALGASVPRLRGTRRHPAPATPRRTRSDSTGRTWPRSEPRTSTTTTRPIAPYSSGRGSARRPRSSPGHAWTSTTPR